MSKKFYSVVIFLICFFLVYSITLNSFNEVQSTNYKKIYTFSGLVINSIAIEPKMPKPGDRIQIIIEVENRGLILYKRINLVVKLKEKTIGNTSIYWLRPGAKISKTIYYTLPKATQGKITFEVVANPPNGPKKSFTIYVGGLKYKREFSPFKVRPQLIDFTKKGKLEKIDLETVASQDYSDVEIFTLNIGEGKIEKPVKVKWELFDNENNILQSGKIYIPPDKIYSKEHVGKVIKPSSKISIYKFFKKVGCKVKLMVDPDNEIPETNEENNTFEVKFGDCKPVPKPQDPEKVVDLVPEFDESLLQPPDQHGNRKLFLRIYNKGTAPLRKRIRFEFYLYPIKVRGERKLHPYELPINSGESKVIDTGFSIWPEHYQTAKEIEFILDTEYEIPELDKLNNVIRIPLGRGEKPEEGNPDYLIEFRKFTSPYRGKLREIEIHGIVKNKGKGDGPFKVPLELSLIDSENKGIYIDNKTLNQSVPHIGGGVPFEIKIEPIEYFQKACKIKLTVDPENSIPEENENNNICEIKLPFCGKLPPKPDLKVNKITVKQVGEESYMFEAECENIGNDIGNRTFQFHWYLDGKKIDTIGYLSLNKNFPIPLEKFTIFTTIPAKELENKNSVRVKFEIDNIGNFEEHNLENNIMEIELKLPTENK